MQAVLPSVCSRSARVGDVLVLGRFFKSGSSAQDKEPFLAFYDPNRPSQIVALCNGSDVLVHCPSSTKLDGWYAVYLVQAVHPATRKKLKDGRLVFFANATKSEMTMEKGELPADLSIEVLTIEMATECVR